MTPLNGFAMAQYLLRRALSPDGVNGRTDLPGRRHPDGVISEW